ncbi:MULTISPECIES: hypothetical protein [unclassified Paenibacillus]|uniref:hypothetical protein n=1 Tax=unclassified Paenibacillus TaxID=185978 RepID=UPI003640D2CE
MKKAYYPAFYVDDPNEVEPLIYIDGDYVGEALTNVWRRWFRRTSVTDLPNTYAPPPVIVGKFIGRMARGDWQGTFIANDGREYKVVDSVITNPRTREERHMLKLVTIMTGPYEFQVDPYDIYRGYLVADGHAMYVAENGDIWLLGVVPTDKPDVVMQESAHVKMGEISGQDGGEIILHIANELNGMSGLDFMIRYVVHSDYEIEFDLLSKPPDDGTSGSGSET